METCDQNAVDGFNGFSFSQELTSGLSQMNSQNMESGKQTQNSLDGFGFSQELTAGLSHMNSQDSGWFSGDSQSLSQPFGGIAPQKRPLFDQMVPPSFPEVKKAKYNLPKWTKGLLKTAEENQKLKNHEVLLKRQEEDYG